MASADDTVPSVVRFTVMSSFSFAKAAFKLLLSILRETNFGGTVSALSNPTKVGIETADKLFPAKSSTEPDRVTFGREEISKVDVEKVDYVR